MLCAFVCSLWPSLFALYFDALFERKRSGCDFCRHHIVSHKICHFRCCLEKFVYEKNHQRKNFHREEIDMWFSSNIISSHETQYDYKSSMQANNTPVHTPIWFCWSSGIQKIQQKMFEWKLHKKTCLNLSNFRIFSRSCSGSSKG